MTQYLKDRTEIPNWLMTLFVGAILTMFAAGWVKVDTMETEIVKLQEARIYRSEQICRIETKLDEILKRMREIERNR